MTNILNSPDYKVLQVTELEHDYQVHAEVTEPPTRRPIVITQRSSALTTVMK